MAESNVKNGGHPRPIEVLLGNREALRRFLDIDEVLYTPPASTDHYVHLFPHDAKYAGYTYAHFGYLDEAVTEIFSVLSGQDARGFSPNQHFAVKGRRHDLERKFFKNPKKSSDYSHPPTAAMVCEKIYDAFQAAGQPDQADIFLTTAYPYLRREYGYFHNYRRHSQGNPLKFNTHPHEPGSDSEPITDFIRLRIPRNGPDTPEWKNWINRRTDYLSTSLVLSGLMLACGWQEQRTRRFFEFYSPMYNAMMVDNELIMSELAEKIGLLDDAEYFRQSAQELEQAISEHMWDKDAARGIGLFHGLRGQSLEHVKKAGISNLYPLLLPNLSEEQLESLLDLYEICFDTPEINYPVPTTPPINPHTLRPNPDYDPRHAEKDRLDRGPFWMHHNFNLAVRGFRRQAQRPEMQHRPDLVARCQAHDQRITTQSKEWVKHGYSEFGDPETGEHQRTNRVRDFSWSTLADTM